MQFRALQGKKVPSGEDGPRALSAREICLHLVGSAHAHRATFFHSEHAQTDVPGWTTMV